VGFLVKLELTKRLSSLYTQWMKKTPALEGLVRSFTPFEMRLTGRSWDWPATLLVIVLVQISSMRLAITEWVPSLDVTQTISLYAVVLGLALGYSAFTRRNAIWTAVEYGLLLIPLQLLTAIERTGNTYNDLRHLFLRLFDSLRLFFQNQPVYDTLFFILLTAMGFWVVGLYVGYRFARHRDFLDVTLAPGLIILLVQIYDPWIPWRAWGLAVYIFVGLALLGRMHYLKNRDRWKKQHVFLSSDTEWEFSRSILSTAAIAVVIAWVLPGAVTNIKPASEAWRNFTRPIIERLSDAVSALDAPYGPSTGGDFYGTDLKLGGSAPISDTQVFYVEVKDDAQIPRYYWRGRVYDRYENGQWTSTSSLRKSFNPQEDEVLLADGPDRVEANLEITINFPKQELLYAPAEMIWVDRAGRMFAHPSGAGEAFEVTAWFTDSVLNAGDRYQVRALIANPTTQDLRAAGTDYPAWVTESYLQVPAEMHPQLQELAARITAPYSIPYDKVQAITSYLRHEIQYETQITEAPPRGEDPLLWVLFDHKKGFCMYYASAEVLLLRTLGIPARMAVGFAQGEYDAARERYNVARLNSHAWPEVYFPGIGWVEFEPTANQNSLNRPQGNIESASNNEEDLQNSPPAITDEEPGDLPDFDPTLIEDEVPGGTSQANPWDRFLAFIAVLFLLAIGIYLLNHHSVMAHLPVYLVERYVKSGSEPPRWLSNWANWSRLLPIEKAFHTINLSLRWLGEARPSYTTSTERARTLARLLPAAQEAIDRLAHEHETALFTPRTANLALARRASFKIIVETWRTRIFRYRETLKQRYN
jgi:transglutaminase-like putative cysteine protease